MTADDIENDKDLVRYFMQRAKLFGVIGRETAGDAAMIKAMLRVRDRAMGPDHRNRHKKVAYPIAAAAFLMIPAQALMKRAGQQLRTLYAVDMGLQRPQRRRQEGIRWTSDNAA